jgi:hypothetical protein
VLTSDRSETYSCRSGSVADSLPHRWFAWLTAKGWLPFRWLKSVNECIECVAYFVRFEVNSSLPFSSYPEENICLHGASARITRFRYERQRNGTRSSYTHLITLRTAPTEAMHWLPIKGAELFCPAFCCGGEANGRPRRVEALHRRIKQTLVHEFPSELVKNHA